MPSKKKRFIESENANTLFGQLDVVVDTLIDILVATIDSSHRTGNIAYAHTIDSVLKKLQMTNKDSDAYVKNSATLKYYRFFLKYTSTTAAEFFLESCKAIPILEGDFGSGPRDETKFYKLPAFGLMADRVKTAKTLAKMTMSEIESRSAHYDPKDVDRAVSLRVRVFVGRVRALAQLHARRNPHEVCACSCCGLKMVQVRHAGHDKPPHPMSFGSDEADDASVESDDEESVALPFTSIWARTVPSIASFNLPTMQMCSNACFHKYQEELRLAVPVSYVLLEELELGYVGASKIGLPRVAATARAVVKRNADVLRAIREGKRTLKRQQARCLSESQIQTVQDPIFDLLNLDAALLLAAGELAESAAMCRGRALPGCTSNWRSEPWRYSAAIERIRSMYFQFDGPRSSRGKQINELAPPAWLRKVLANADSLFPVRSDEI